MFSSPRDSASSGPSPIPAGWVARGWVAWAICPGDPPGLARMVRRRGGAELRVEVGGQAGERLLDLGGERRRHRALVAGEREQLGEARDRLLEPRALLLAPLLVGVGEDHLAVDARDLRQ